MSTQESTSPFNGLPFTLFGLSLEKEAGLYYYRVWAKSNNQDLIRLELIGAKERWVVGDAWRQLLFVTPKEVKIKIKHELVSDHKEEEHGFADFLMEVNR